MRMPVLATLAILASGGQALACSCVGAPDPATHIAGYDHIFRGTVVSGGLSAWDPQFAGSGSVSAVIAVSESYKGDAGDVAIIGTALSSATCGVSLTIGQSAVFFASRENDFSPFSINLCGQAPYQSDPGGFDTALDALPGSGAFNLRRPIVIDRPIRITPLRRPSHDE